MSHVPSDAVQTGIVTKYEFLNYFRARRFYVLLVIGLAISVLLTVVVAYRRSETFLSSPLAFYSGWWGMSVDFVIVLSGIFFGADAISNEFQNRTGYFLVPNPIKRSSIYAGKWLASLMASLVILVIYTAITVANGVYYFGLDVPYQLWESIGFAIVYLAAVLGFSFFLSSIFKSSSISILVTAILFLFVFPFLETLILPTLVGMEPWFLITYGAEIVGQVLTVPYPQHIATQQFGPQFSITTYTPTIPEGLIILVV